MLEAIEAKENAEVCRKITTFWVLGFCKKLSYS
jgi:hypothetical protein